MELLIASGFVLVFIFVLLVAWIVSYFRRMGGE